MSRVQQVREFMLKHNFPVDETPTKLNAADLEALCRAWSAVETHAKKLRAHPNSSLNRFGLILEETCELMMALASTDRVEQLDALADLEYVTIGTAVAWGLPLEAAFDEVHRSNMTKAPRQSGDNTLVNKGAEYEPPQLARLLEGEACHSS